MGELKPGWKRVKLGDVVDVVTDYWDRDPNKPERFVAGEHIDEGALKVARWGMTSDELVPPTFNRRFKAGDVLFHSRNLRKLARPDFSGITGEKLFVLRSKSPRDLNPELLPFLLQTNAFNDYVNSMWAGSTNKFLNKAPLIRYDFALPPLEEQRRLAQVLSCARDAVDATGGVLAQLVPLVERFIDAALEGNLSGLPPELSVGLHPTRWRRCVLGDLCLLSNGNGFRPADWSDRGLPIIRIQNVRGSSAFNYYAGTPDPKWIVEPGELLFAWAGVPGVSFGPGIWSGPRGVLNQHIYRVTPKDGVHRQWLYELLRFLTPRIERRAHGFKHNLLHIRQAEFKRQIVSLPSPVEQERIVSAVTQLRAWIVGVEARCSSSRAIQANLMRKIEAP